ncbi:hypothetical protein Hanom_Chr16g01467491 [Helianthus anomalus]
MMLYPRFLMIIFRHLIPDLPIHEGLAPHVLKATGKRIFSDCRNVKASVHSPRFPELRPMLGIFGAREDEDGAAPVVVEHVVEPVVEPVAEPVNEPLHDVEMEEVIHNISFDQPELNLNDIIFDRALDAIDVSLESGAPSSSTSKGKGILVEEDDVEMLTGRKYLSLVRKDFLGKLSAKGQEKLKAFRDKGDSLGPSSEWALRLSLWNEKTSNLDNFLDDSSNSDSGGDPDRRLIVVSVLVLLPGLLKLRMFQLLKSQPQ